MKKKKSNIVELPSDYAITVRLLALIVKKLDLILDEIRRNQESIKDSTFVE
jgi:hypothetical protein